MPADLKRGSTVLGHHPQTESPALVEVKKLQFRAVLELLKQQSQPHLLWGLPGPSTAFQTFKAAVPQKASSKDGRVSFLLWQQEVTQFLIFLIYRKGRQPNLDTCKQEVGHPPWLSVANLFERLLIYFESSGY